MIPILSVVPSMIAANNMRQNDYYPSSKKDKINNEYIPKGTEKQSFFKKENFKPLSTIERR